MSIKTNYSSYQLNRNVNSSVGFRNATLVGGVAIAWGIVNPASALGYLAATVCGAVGSLFAYGLGAATYDLYNRRCYRAVAPLLIEEKTAQHENSLTEAFERVKQFPCYELFKKIRLYKNDKEALSYFQTAIQRGYCFGSVSILLQIIDKNPQASCSDLLKSLDLTQVYFSQLVHTMLADFHVAEKIVQSALRGDQILTNAWNQCRGLLIPTLKDGDPDKLQKAKILERLAPLLQDTIVDIQKLFIP